VIPVLFGAAMPSPIELPRSIRALTEKQAIELRHTSYDDDLKRLISRLDELSDERPEEEAKPRPRPPLPAPPDPAGQLVPSPSEDHYRGVIDGILEGSVVPVLGKSVRGSLPDADDLARHIADRCSVDHRFRDLAAIAQYVAITKGRRRLYSIIQEVLTRESEPTAIHHFLSGLPRVVRELGLEPRPQMIVTSGYDRALERAFEEADEPFDYAIYSATDRLFVHVPWGDHDPDATARPIREPKNYTELPFNEDGELERTLIVKVHGAAECQDGPIRWENNYVVTEDQYIDYLPAGNVHKLVPVQILAKLKNSQCLFLGYTLRDWNERVFLRRIWQGESISEKSWAIEAAPDLLEKESWIATQVELLTASPLDYVDQLAARLSARSAVPA
jgi:hypothetical protein